MNIINWYLFYTWYGFFIVCKAIHIDQIDIAQTTGAYSVHGAEYREGIKSTSIITIYMLYPNEPINP